MYSKFAKWYDLHYRSLKDYEKEAERIDYILRKFEPKPQRILDVACGTGEHARVLSTRYGYQVDGIDLEPNLVEIAAAKNPNGEFTVADMRSFSLPRQYDVAMCLFSSIAYTQTEEGLETALKQIAGHLKPGGRLIIESWVDARRWNEGIVDASESYDEETQTKVLQAREGRTEGDLSILNIDYHISTPEGEIEFSEVHKLGLFSRAQLEDSFRRCGFEPNFIPEGVLERSIFIGKLMVG